MPANISVANAQLPQAYEAAKQALATCVSIDECQDWADKAAALASYAKQANDETLMKQSVRIRDRAIRRCGELLKQFDAKGRNQYSEDSGDAPTKLSQREAAERAGISRDQQVTAVRVANVPADDFERMVESDHPPTITKLAEIGKKSAPRPIIDLQGRDPGEFNRAMHYIGPVQEYASELRRADHEAIIPTLNEAERRRLRDLIAEIDRIHDMIVTRI